MKTKSKNLVAKFSATFIALALLFTCFTYVSAFAVQAASTSDDEMYVYQTESIGVSNSLFEESSTLLADPTNWTGTYINPLASSASSSGTNGLIDLSPSAIDYDTLEEYKLNDDYYDEYKSDMPRSPFSYEDNGSNSQALMINAGPMAKDAITFAYNSSSFTLEANSYYSISVWVKTSEGATATIKLAQPDDATGMTNEVAFTNVNTFNYHNYAETNSGRYDYASINQSENYDYGWAQYSFFIETSTLSDSSASLSLQLGDYSEWIDDDGKTHVTSNSNSSSGYAMFDNVEIFRYAPDVFEHHISQFNKSTGYENIIEADDDRFFYTESSKSDPNKMFYSENDAVFLSIDSNNSLLGLEDTSAETEQDYLDNVMGDFTTAAGWSAADGTFFNGRTLHTGVINYVDTTEDSAIGIEYQVDIPLSPNGENDEIGYMTSYDSVNSMYNSECFGVTTEKFTIQRHKYYRLSVWTKSLNTDCANVVVCGEDYRGLDTTYGKDQLYFSSGLTGYSDGVASRNNWNEVVFMIEGSAFQDYKINVELWLGIGADVDNDGNTVSEETVQGTAFFDDLKIEELTATEYINNEASGIAVTFDAQSSTTYLSNSSFDIAGEYTDYEYPLTPADWNYLEVSENTVNGMSKDEVVLDGEANSQEYWDDEIITGIIPTDTEHFNANKQNYADLTYSPGSADHINEEYNNGNNALLLTSDKQVAVGYTSSTFSLTSDTACRIDVAMYTQHIVGYGANIVLKKGDNIIATIEQIGSSQGIYADSDWHTYSFYLKDAYSNVGDITVELWLGLYDDYNNTTKLSSGTILVDYISVTEFSDSDTTFDTYYSDYEYNKNNSNKDWAAYSFADDNFTAFDKYDDDFLKTPYNYTLSDSSSDNISYGIFDSSYISSNAYLWDGYSNENANDQYKMYLGNGSSSYSKLTSKFSQNVTTEEYLSITFTVKVNIPTTGQNADYQGAFFGIRSDSLTTTFTDVKNTSEVYDILNPGADETEYFQEYTIYVEGSETVDDVDQFYLVFGLGGDSTNQYTKGTLIVADIAFNTITQAEYNTADESTSGNILTHSYSTVVDESDTETDSDYSVVSTSQSWMIISSIILAIVLIIVVITVAFRKIMKNRFLASAKQKYNHAQYARTASIEGQVESRTTGGRLIKANSYESFDEDLDMFSESIDIDDTTDPTIEEQSTDTEEVIEVAENMDEAEGTDVESSDTVETEVIVPDEVIIDSVEANEEDEINYDEVVEFTAPKFIPKKTETIIADVPVKKEKDSTKSTKPDWDTFDE